MYSTDLQGALTKRVTYLAANREISEQGKFTCIAHFNKAIQCFMKDKEFKRAHPMMNLNPMLNLKRQNLHCGNDTPSNLGLTDL